MTASSMRPIKCVFYTGAGPSLVREDLVQPDWLPSIRLSDNPRLRSATNENVDVVGTVILHVQIGDIRVRVIFGIVRSFAAPALLRTSLMHKCIKGIFPTNRKIVTSSCPSGQFWWYSKQRASKQQNNSKRPSLTSALYNTKNQPSYAWHAQ